MARGRTGRPVQEERSEAATSGSSTISPMPAAVLLGAVAACGSGFVGRRLQRLERQGEFEFLRVVQGAIAFAVLQTWLRPMLQKDVNDVGLPIVGGDAKGRAARGYFRVRNALT